MREGLYAYSIFLFGRSSVKEVSTCVLHKDDTRIVDLNVEVIQYGHHLTHPFP